MTVLRSIATIAALAMPLALTSAFAENPVLQVRLSDETVEVGQRFYIIIEAKGSSILAPRIPSADGLQIDARPSRQHTTIMNLPGVHSECSKVLGYSAMALKEGALVIPPIEMEIDGVLHSSDPVVVRATPSDNRRSPQARIRREPEERRVEELRVDEIAFLRTEVDKREVYAGEPVSLILTYGRLAESSVRVSSPQSGIEFTFPDTEGFYCIPERPEEIERAQETIDGRRYWVMRWRQTLFATTPGSLEIPAWEWSAMVHAYTVRGPWSAPLELGTEPIAIEVKPLPRRPAHFSGAVGAFTFDTTVTPHATKQSVPVALIVRVNGTGNPAAIAEPQLPSLDGVHISEPERVMQPILSPAGISAETVFSYRITPLRPGPLTIPELEFSYFDPEREQYVVEKTPALVVSVEASGEKNRRFVAGAEVAPEPMRSRGGPETMLPIVTASQPLRYSSPSTAKTGLLVVCPPLAYGLVVAWTARRRRFTEDRPFARSYRAKSRMRKRLRRVLVAADPADALYRAVNGYIADKFDLPEPGMTSADARDLFEARAIGHEAAGNLVEILHQCERDRYGGAAVSHDQIASLIEEAQANMDRLDLWLRRESG